MNKIKTNREKVSELEHINARNILVERELKTLLIKEIGKCAKIINNSDVIKELFDDEDSRIFLPRIQKNGMLVTIKFYIKDLLYDKEKCKLTIVIGNDEYEEYEEVCIDAEHELVLTLSHLYDYLLDYLLDRMSVDAYDNYYANLYYGRY